LPTSPAGSEKKMENKKENGEDEDNDLEDERHDQPQERQDMYVCFTNDKDLRHPETISIKA
jgi:hypothetical protein